MPRFEVRQTVLPINRMAWRSLLTATVLLAAALPACAEIVRVGAASSSQNALFVSLMQAEKQGGSDRKGLIDAVIAQSPDNAAGRGLGGFMRYKGQWTTAEAVAQQLQKNAELRQYQQRRGRYANTPTGQRGLAVWCEAHHLPDQQRAHLTRLLQMAPDDAAARVKLGYVRINGTWVVQEEIRRSIHALEVWLPRLQGLHYQLIENRKPGALPNANYEHALKDWKAINDPAAIPAMERVFSMRKASEGAAMVVEKLRGMDDAEATESLARHALWIDDIRIREEAAAELKKRPLEHYVPALLAGLYSPASVQAALVSRADGCLLLRQIFSGEAADSVNVTTVDSLYRFQGSEPFSPLSPGQIVVAAAQAQVNRENRMRTAINNRICEILAATTGVRLPAVPEAWWQWWNDTNEVYVEGEKQVATAYYCRDISVVSPLPPIVLNPARRSRDDDDSRKDCLVAGTPVWTEHGPVAIDKIRVGDMLLAQSAKTGELAFKPVLKTTTRRPGLLLRIESEQTQLQCSGGHRFWVAGRGWVKARLLAPGDPLHSAAGALTIISAGPGQRLATFNVVVADFHTYFVGPEKLLSHDNTLVEPAPGPLPGLRAD